MQVLLVKLVKNFYILRTDNGGEYMSNEFKKYLRDNLIEHETTNPYSPEQNGVAERMNRTLIEKARAMIIHAGLSYSFWGESVNTAVYLTNRLPTQALGGDISPYEKWYSRKLDLSNLRVFGCIGYAHVPDQQHTKLEPKAVKLRFVGYGKGSKGYRMLEESRKTVVMKRDVVFNESCFDMNSDKVDLSSWSVTVSEKVEDSGENDTGVYVDQRPERPARIKRPIVRYGIDEHVAHCAMIVTETKSMGEALSSEQAEDWKRAADEEYSSLMEHETWELTELPVDRKPVGCKWVFKIKHDENGDIERYKCRLVAQGFSQTQGIDYDETFAPVARFNTIRSLLAMAVNRGMIIEQMDVVTVFLNGMLKEEIFMSQPPGFVEKGKEELVCRLKRSLYGLKQSPICWYDELRVYLTEIEFRQCTSEPCVFYRWQDDSLSIVTVYVDDLIIMVDVIENLIEIKEKLASRFKMKDMGSLSYCLGIGVRQSDGMIQIHQRQYIASMLQLFGMQDAYPVHTPSDPSVNLVKDDGVSAKADKQLFRQIIGSLSMQLAVHVQTLLMLLTMLLGTVVTRQRLIFQQLSAFFDI